MPNPATAVIRLGRVEIDTERESVRRDGVEHKLRRRTFEVLLHLVENRDREVSKNELFETVWRGVAVTEDTLVQSIVEIRKAFGDDPRSPQFVRTIPRVGYRLIAPPDEGPSKVPQSRRRLVPVLASVALLVLVGVAAVVWWMRDRSEGQTAPLRRITSDRMTDSLEAYEAYRRGVVAADALRNREAIRSLERAIQLDPEFAMAYARIGYAYGVTWMQPDRARPYFAKALALQGRLSERERLYVLAWQAITERDYSRAIDHFRLLITRAPTDVEAYERLGKLLIGEERLTEAVDVLSRGLLVEEDSPELHNALGTAHSYMSQHAEAIRHHQRYVALRPTEPNAHDSLGLSYQWAGRYVEALAAYDRALRVNPQFEIARIHRANAYWQLGRNREALREYRAFIDTTTAPIDRVRGWCDIALIRRGNGDIEGMAEAIEQVRREGAETELFDALLAADRRDVHLTKHLQSIRGDQFYGRGQRNSLRLPSFVRTQAALAAGDERRAIAYARETVRHAPPVYLGEDFEDTLADTLAAFGRHEEAIAEYRRVLGINANRGRTRYKLARTLEAAGRLEEARSEYAQFLRVWSSADRDAPEMAAPSRILSGSERRRPAG